jgi:hypothetical protein
MSKSSINHRTLFHLSMHDSRAGWASGKPDGPVAAVDRRARRCGNPAAVIVSEPASRPARSVLFLDLRGIG